MRVLIAYERNQTRVFQIPNKDAELVVLKKLFAERNLRGRYQELTDMESGVLAKALKGDHCFLVLLLDLRKYNIDEKIEWLETEN